MSPRIEDYATIEAHCGPVPVYAFGYTYIYGIGPDVCPDLRLQETNTNPWVKIRPKKSWEISRNNLGSTPAREPKTARNDDQPLLPVHLIDGDERSAWCSRGQPQPDVEPVWIRIDLPVQAEIRTVRLVPLREGMGKGLKFSLWQPSEALVGQALPRRLEIRLSRDGWHWETVYRNDSLPPFRDAAPVEIPFAARQAKQIMVVGNEFPQVLNFGHCFSLSSVEAIDDRGTNLALLSRGAGVTVSSTHTGYGMDRFTQDMLWPIQYDLGFKWSRVGYDMGMFTWAYVEREKGKLEVDPRADAAVTDAVNCGVSVILCLDKGNWLYASTPKRKDRTRELMETYYDRPPEPHKNPDSLEGFLRYVRYMVRHFKDRVGYYEVFNEWFSSAGTVHDYTTFAKKVIAVIREEYPEARIVSVSPGSWQMSKTFVREMIDDGMGPLIDVIAWHPWYHTDPDDPSYLAYPQEFRELKAYCESRGFKGKYFATEWTWSAPYPLPGDRRHWQFPISEMIKAKLAAQLTTRHAGMGVVSLWNETFQSQYTSWSIGLLRNTASGEVLAPQQPEIVYYVQRNLSTILEDVDADDCTVEISPADCSIEVWKFRRGNGERLVALWRRGRPSDVSVGTRIDVTIGQPGIGLARIVDPLNGREQTLVLAPRKNGVAIPGVLVPDFPVFIVYS